MSASSTSGRRDGARDEEVPAEVHLQGDVGAPGHEARPVGGGEGRGAPRRARRPAPPPRRRRNGRASRTWLMIARRGGPRRSCLRAILVLTCCVMTKREEAGQYPVHPRPPPHRLPRPALDHAAVRGLRHRRRVQPPLPLPARARHHRPLRGLRPAHADRLRLRRPARRWARWAAWAWPSTASRTWRRCSTASRSSGSRRR